MAPATRYTRTGDGTHIAYQVIGDGPVDIVYVPGWIWESDLLWSEPRLSRFFERIASFSRLILFDRRGSGQSDPVVGAPTLEEQMDDVRAVLDAAGSERAAMWGVLEGGPMAMLFAATYPERTRALILYAAFARTVATHGYEWADSIDARNYRIDRTIANWGRGTMLDVLAPTLSGDSRLREWLGRLERRAAPPATARKMMEITGRTDIRHVLPSIRVPTLIVHRTHDPMMDVRHGRYLAEHIPDAKYLELPGSDSLIFASDHDRLLEEMREFLTGARHGREPDRVLATVLFTDLVRSTERAAELGDRRWRALLSEHYDAVRQALARYDGREIKTIGDGFVATFDGPARAVRAAQEATRAVAALGLELRAGLHTGEVEMMEDDVGGMAVHIAARVMAAAGAGEVVVSSTVKDLVVGSGIEFADRGMTELRGVPGEWRLWAALPAPALGAAAA